MFESKLNLLCYTSIFQMIEIVFNKTDFLHGYIEIIYFNKSNVGKNDPDHFLRNKKLKLKKYVLEIKN